jgi:hypothetical protein
MSDDKATTTAKNTSGEVKTAVILNDAINNEIKSGLTLFKRESGVSMTQADFLRRVVESHYKESLSKLLKSKISL